MKEKSMWAILIATTIIVSLAMVSSPVAACFGHTTSCEGDSVYQGDGGATDYWYDDLYPPEHEIMNGGESTSWIIKVNGGGGCSGYEHCTVTDSSPPSGWSTTVVMGDIRKGSFHFIDDNSPVNKGDDIEMREFYIGNSWDFDINYTVKSPPGASGGESADMKCTVYVVGYLPENQHDYVYVYCNATISAIGQPSVSQLYPNGGEILTGTETLIWEARDPNMDPLSFEIYLSSDGGETYPDLLASVGDVRIWDWDTTPYPDGINYKLKIIVFDGTNYGRDYSDLIFSIDNVAPDPPSNLVIYFGLKSNAEPMTKAPDDTTGSALERIQKDDSRGYIVSKGKLLSLETFNISTQNDPVESATLYVEYWVENNQYNGFNSVMWKLETDISFQSTGITPVNTEISPVIKSFDLYANGVDTIDKITNLDIQFLNNDVGLNQNVSFDYIWVTFKASLNDLGLTWKSSISPDINHYHIYRSPDDVTYSLVGETTSAFWNDDGGRGIDLNNYFYRINSVDHGAHEGLPTYTVAKYVIPVANNWNIVSTPLIQLGDDSTCNALYSIDGNYEAVQAYHAGNSRPWLHWHFSKPSNLNNLVSMNHIDGYYIFMQSSDDFITLGRLPGSEGISLKTGWNLIGYPSLTSKTRDVALTTISGKYDAVFRFDTAAGREVQVQSGDLMSPGNGYWIHVIQDCDLTI